MGYIILCINSVKHREKTKKRWPPMLRCSFNLLTYCKRAGGINLATRLNDVRVHVHIYMDVLTCIYTHGTPLGHMDVLTYIYTNGTPLGHMDVLTCIYTHMAHLLDTWMY